MDLWDELNADMFKNYGPPDGHNFAAYFSILALKHNAPFLSFAKIGQVEDIPNLIEAIKQLGYSSIGTEHESVNSINYIFTTDSSVIDLNTNKGRTSTSRVVSFDEGEFNRSRDLLNSFIVRNPIDDGTIYSICQSPDGLSTTSIGKAGIEYIPDNYAPEVVEKFGKAIADLESDNPLGRLLVLEGDPGTGKSMLVRMLIGLTPNSKHYLVPPNLVGQLGSPAVVPLLVTLAEEKEGQSHPSIFILEDADECLLPRQGDNISSISAMLNLTDGILGRMIDIRLVVTSNARRVEMDAALMRPGRLSQHIYIGELEKEHASKVYTRLSGKEKTYRQPMTLAEIYADAAGMNIEKAERRMGF